MNYDHTRYVADGAAGSVAVASLLGWLPPLASALTIIWIGLQIYWGIKDRYFKKDK